MRTSIVAIAVLHFSIAIAQAQESAPGRIATSTESSETSNTSVTTNSAIDFAGFVKLSADLQQIRNARRIPIAKFNEMSREPQTIILDTRSKWAFDVVHVAGAIHLNFSDFTAEKLRKVIPDKQTKILIYCNNNFSQLPQTDRLQLLQSLNALNSVQTEDSNPDSHGEKDAREAIVESTVNKAPPLALNIPTFINLHGYGYTNVYELADQLDLNDSRLKLVGTGVTKQRPKP